MDRKQILNECCHNQACAELSRANNLALYEIKPRMNTIPNNCEWCDTSFHNNNTIFNNTMYYFNSPTEHKLLCGDCGSRIKTKNEDNDIIFCYKIEPRPTKSSSNPTIPPEERCCSWLYKPATWWSDRMWMLRNDL
jgi:hypothetical protein